MAGIDVPPQMDHPFVVNLRYAFQDDGDGFSVLDLMLGGDLRSHLERLGSLTKDTVRFYMADLSSAVAYLHVKKIIHRDLKPDNILLDERGHAHITDLNIAVHYSERRLLNGVAGVLAKKGYTYTIDCRRPFRGKTNSELKHTISRDHLKFPKDAESKCSRDGLDTARRLGCKPNGEGMACLVPHDSLGTLGSKVLEPPFSKKANFDVTHELEELLPEDHPLKERRRNPSQDIKNPSTEYRHMEEQFTSYDFRKMQRRSYYSHHNQQLISSVTATTSSGMGPSRPTTPATFERLGAESMPHPLRGKVRELDGFKHAVWCERITERVNDVGLSPVEMTVRHRGRRKG
ncbi:kinase-like domain-containing protein [Gautieria morchelliformis]|nr:kinase-like domain-containing protein [Gautieria morchelliformis]